MNEDMSQYLGVFLDEANEQMDLLERDILVLEQEPSQELLQGIFRAAHTLKGSSRAMGFTEMGELTHAMEDVFDKLRHDELTVNNELINALFTGLDSLKAMKDEIATSGTTTLDTTTQTARLRAVLDGSPAPMAPPAAAPAAAASAPATAQPVPAAPVAEEEGPGFITALSETAMVALQDALSADYEVFGLKVQVAPDCMMKSVRALMVLQAIERIGSILATTPNEEDLEEEKFESEFEVVLATKSGVDAVRSAADSVNEVRDVHVAIWTNIGTGNEQLISAPAPAPEKPSAPVEAVAAPISASDERQADAGPEARGKAPEEVQKIAAEKKPAAAAAPPPAQAATVRVDVTRLDKLLNLVGELVIDRTRIAQLGTQFEQQYEFNPLVESLNETASHIGRITDELQEEIMKARMLPVDNVFNRFPRMVRDLAQKLEKEVNFIVEGKETELDRSVIEVIGDPLIHMIRNSVDHGIELPDEREATGKPRTGNVWLRARHEENHIVIEIQDDGKGIDPDKLKSIAISKGILTQEAAARMTDKEGVMLIFAPGFSTAKEITDVSGRGVGMDIVKSNLQKLGALIDIESKVGVGSTFTVKLPLTLAIIRGLLITVHGVTYALPLASVMETIKIEEEEIHVVNHREVILQRGKTLPIVRLRDIFPVQMTPAELTLARMDAIAVQTDEDEDALLIEAGEASTSAHLVNDEPPSLYLVIVGLADKRVGLVVDTLIGEQEVVIKTLGKLIGDIKGISGATILGDGRVALIVDVNGLITVATEEKGRAYAG